MRIPKRSIEGKEVQAIKKAEPVPQSTYPKDDYERPRMELPEDFAESAKDCLKTADL